jgi:ATP-dependent Zn protease
MTLTLKEAFEAKRYRQQIMLHEITVRSRRLQMPALETRAKTMLQELTAISWTDNATVSAQILSQYQKKIIELGSSVDIVFSNERSHPRWLQFLGAGLPVLLALLFGLFIMQRRRRLKALSKSEVESLEEAGDKD